MDIVFASTLRERNLTLPAPQKGWRLEADNHGRMRWVEHRPDGTTTIHRFVRRNELDDAVDATAVLEREVLYGLFCQAFGCNPTFFDMTEATVTVTMPGWSKAIPYQRAKAKNVLQNILSVDSPLPHPSLSVRNEEVGAELEAAIFVARG